MTGRRERGVVAAAAAARDVKSEVIETENLRFGAKALYCLLIEAYFLSFG